MIKKYISILVLSLFLVSFISAYEITYPTIPWKKATATETINGTIVTTKLPSYSQWNPEGYETICQTEMYGHWILDPDIPNEEDPPLIYVEYPVENCFTLPKTKTTEGYYIYLNELATNYFANWQPDQIETIKLNKNIQLNGFILADGFYYNTEGKTDYNVNQAITLLENIKNTPDGQLDNTTLPERGKVIVGGEIRRNTSTMLSDMLGLFLRISI